MLQCCGGGKKISVHTWETKESFEGVGGFISWVSVDSNRLSSRRTRPLPGNQLLNRGARREEAMFYIRTVNHSSLALYFSCSRRFGWAERSGASGAAMGGGMRCGSWNLDTEGLTGRLWTEGCWAITQPPGGAYLKQSPVWTVALKHCYCTAAA